MAVIAAAACTSCMIGPQTGEYGGVATAPYGAVGRLAMRDADEIDIELVAVSDTALIVFTGGAYAIVPLDRVRGLDLSPYMRARYNFRNSDRVREDLRVVSRFPHGIPDNVLADLLRATGQSELTLLGNPRE